MRHSCVCVDCCNLVNSPTISYLALSGIRSTQLGYLWSPVDQPIKQCVRILHLICHDMPWGTAPEWHLCHQDDMPSFHSSRQHACYETFRKHATDVMPWTLYNVPMTKVIQQFCPSEMKYQILVAIKYQKESTKKHIIYWNDFNEQDCQHTQLP